ncbi:hypothetical protein [Streptomyces minutiscleroticus]|uniref:hypothetical protein n=1 Tax=Streptomyces minutiscleroticus TaxID=68238 RepID=UPI00331B378A
MRLGKALATGVAQERPRTREDGADPGLPLAEGERGTAVSGGEAAREAAGTAAKVPAAR